MFVSSGMVRGYPAHPFEADDDALIDAEQEAADAFDCAINEIQACIGKLKVQQTGASDPDGCFASAISGLEGSISDLEYGKRKAVDAAREVTS